ncbi:MAG: hypothetical protein ACPLXS_03615, partial [Candidatus Micrarchaeales archaeon]
TNNSILNFFQLASYDEEKNSYKIYPTNLYFSLNTFSLFNDVRRKTGINLCFLTDFSYSGYFGNLAIKDLIVGIASHEVRHCVQYTLKPELLDFNPLVKETKIEKLKKFIKIGDMNEKEVDALIVEILCAYSSSMGSSDYEVAEIIKSDAEEIKRKFSPYLRN